MNRARLLTAAVAATIALFAPAAAHAAGTPSPQVQAQITAQKAMIGSFDAAIKAVQTQMAANQQQVMIAQVQFQAALARGPYGAGEAAFFQAQMLQAQERNRQLAGTLGTLLNQRAMAQAKLAQLLATP